MGGHGGLGRSTPVAPHTLLLSVACRPHGRHRVGEKRWLAGPATLTATGPPGIHVPVRSAVTPVSHKGLEDQL